MSDKQKPRRPLTKPRWSKEEDDIIRQYYATEGSAVYKRMSGRTKAACILRAKNIGIVCNKEVRYQRENTWTEEELAILQEYYPIEGRNVSERLPNRTASQCSAKANSMKIHMLGAKKSHYRWTPEDDETLKRYYPIEGEACFTRFPYRTYRACRTRAKLFGLAELRLVPWTAEEDRILIENYPTMRAKVTKLLPGRSQAACCQRACILNIAKRRSSRR